MGRDAIGDAGGNKWWIVSTSAICNWRRAGVGAGPLPKVSYANRWRWELKFSKMRFRAFSSVDHGSWSHMAQMCSLHGEGVVTSCRPPERACSCSERVNCLCVISVGDVRDWKTAFWHFLYASDNWKWEEGIFCDIKFAWMLCWDHLSLGEVMSAHSGGDQLFEHGI